MPAIHISRSIEIDASAAQVFDVLRDFQTWPEWSPWLVAEPTATLNFAGDGKGYTWSGSYVGAGEIEIISEATNEWIQYDLLFLKPWKSKAKFRFDLESAGNGKTRVSWTMDSSLPFFMFFMKKMMEAYIGMDYERGLLMLKDLVELGEVPFSLEFGETKAGPYQLVGIKTECAISELGDVMSNDIERIKAWKESSGVGETGGLLSVYHRWDPVKGRVAYTTGFPVSNVPDDLSDEFSIMEIPESQAYSVTLTGPYRHLGNAWSAGIMRARSGAFKQSKTALPFERYENQPQETPERDLVTTVCFPMQ